MSEDSKHEEKISNELRMYLVLCGCLLCLLQKQNATDVSGGHGIKNTVSRTLVVLLAFCACCVERSSC
jgi:hypothetical protein